MTPQDGNLARFKRYRDLYPQSMSPQELEQARRRFTPPPEVESLIPGFMELVLGWLGS